MQKYIFAAICFACGILLCALNKSCFVALGAIIGIAMVAGGIILLYKNLYSSNLLVLSSFLIICLGLSFFIANLIFLRTSTIIGGIFFISTGIISIILFKESAKILFPFCGGCALLGLCLIFLPLWSLILCLVGGIFLMFYALVIIFYL